MIVMKEAQAANNAKIDFLNSTEVDRNDAILEIARELENQTPCIIAANELDLDKAKKNHLAHAFIDRLKLTNQRIEQMCTALESIAKQTQVVGEITETITREDGLLIQKQRIPLGVIGMIFESRPNVIIDCSALAIKSGNCIILKGGKEAHHSNHILAKILRQAISKFIPKNVVQLISSRDDVGKLLTQVNFVDVIIPRGGEKLIKFVYENSKIPVIAHFKGLCHIYIDEESDYKSAINIVINAKTQRPGVCNSVETLLLHKDLPKTFVHELFSKLLECHTQLRVCSNTEMSLPTLKRATEEDWKTEYLDNILSIKIVSNIEEAIYHIQKYGSKHSEAIISTNAEHIQAFQNKIDASSIMVNASTRFNDGAEYGLGAELGISTTKLHAYGPMGAKEMTTQRFLVTGQGHTRKS